LHPSSEIVHDNSGQNLDYEDGSKTLGVEQVLRFDCEPFLLTVLS
jgi:hypothetical protein